MDPFTPAVELAGAVARKEISPLELLDACLERVDRLNPALNAVVWRDDDRARADAAALADRLARAGAGGLGPLAGVPIPVKDLTPAAGQPCTYGSSAGPDGPADHDELVVAAFRAGGLVLAGRTNSPEFGSVSVTENLRYGVTRNPWDPDRTPGGSSGGAAAAVASGMFPLAHANDGGGSIRIPASCTGLVGLKPSRGRVPAEVPGWLGCAVEGVVTRTVADTAAALDVVSGPDRLGWFAAPPPGRPFAEAATTDPGRLRVGLLSRAPLDVPVEPAPAEAVAVAGRALEALGHAVEPVDFELIDVGAVLDYLTLVNAGFGEVDGIDPGRLEAHNAAGLRSAAGADSLALAGALARLQRVTRSTVARWGRDFDVLVTPTMAIEPPPAGHVLERLQAEPEQLPPEVLAMAVFTAPINVSGQPAVSLPLYTAPSGLPVGVQVVGGPFAEATLLALAAQLEAAHPWSDRRPAVAA